jgi:hypothetical protein
MITIAKIAAVAATCLTMAACAPTPDAVSSTGPGVAPSGITASNGGGARATSNIPSVAVGGGQATVSGVPNTRGNAY